MKTTLTTDNQQELDGMRAFAAERGVDFRIDGLLNSRLDGRPLPAGIALAARELPRIELTDRRSRESWTARHEQQRHAASSPYHCAAGISAFHVDYRGRLMPCLLARRPARSLIDRDFRAAWDGPIRAAVEGWAAAASACRECALAGCCDTCPGWGLTEQGDPVRPVDRLCHVAAARARELGIEGRPAGTEP